jgi:cysteinyl-tRNA synthetase
MTNQLRLYNTLTRQKEPFAPLDPSRVRMYVCGPTVYDFAHIGNARPVIVFDVLFRLLRHLAKQGVWDGGKGQTEVIYTRNITDVDDKINERAARDYPDLPLNEAIRKVTEGTNAQFQADVKALGCLEPTHQPRATEHIEAMKALCERLVAKGVAYVAEGHVLFSPEAMNNTKSHWPTYGKLANRSLDEMIAGARVDVAPYKKGPTDFVLWKPSADHEPGWASPCGIPGKGRPGWHIECSAMSMATLLEPFGGGLSCDDPLKNTFDIHGGGIDLVFPHHENEIAQSCCAFGSERMAQIWMHNGFLQVEGQKMSKSLGNFVTINELLNTTKFGGRRWPGEVLRLAMLKTHYRQPIDWTIEASKEAEMHLDNWSQLIEGKPVGEVPAGVLSALADDLNTPAMIAELHKTARASDFAGLKAALDLLGFNLAKEGPYKSGVRRAIERAFDKQHIDSLITARLAARAAKNWAESDRIRDELAAMGIQLKDGKDEAGNPVTVKR